VISRYHTYISQSNAGVQAAAGPIMVANLMQVADRFTNLHRDINIADNFTVSALLRSNWLWNKQQPLLQSITASSLMPGLSSLGLAFVGL
jgi:hypothetical protein